MHFSILLSTYLLNFGAVCVCVKVAITSKLNKFSQKQMNYFVPTILTKFVLFNPATLFCFGKYFSDIT